jgi:8-oxo-dGTP pyrophosphatase MutT (NUDIX family)
MFRLAFDATGFRYVFDPSRPMETARADAGDFKEGDHPRDEGGQFTEGGGGGKSLRELRALHKDVYARYVASSGAERISLSQELAKAWSAVREAKKAETPAKPAPPPVAAKEPSKPSGSAASPSRAEVPITAGLKKALPDLKHIKVSKPDKQGDVWILASTAVGQFGNPVTLPGEKGSAGVALKITADKTVHFYEINNGTGKPGLGSKMVEGVMSSLPPDYTVSVHVDLSGGFWEKVSNRYPGKIRIDSVDAEGLAARSDAVWGDVEPPPRRADIRVDSAAWAAPPEMVNAGDLLAAAGMLLVAGGDRGREVLFVRHAARGTWELPGGGIEDGETAEEAAEREVAEEIGPAPHGSVSLLMRHRFGPVDYSTFMARVAAKFDPVLSEELSDWVWAAPDEAPEPLHPGVRLALTRLAMNELDLARAIANGEIDSPQEYENLWLFALRITGTGMSYRPDLKEYVWRAADLYLTPDFLARCNGLTIILEHPPDDMLDSAEFEKRVIGSIMLPYIDGDEVWGIGKIYDQEAAALMRSRQLSTSPSVAFSDPGVNRTRTLESGKTLLLEGIPSLLDHLAICSLGVWDVDGIPAGVAVTSVESVARADAASYPVRLTVELTAWEDLIGLLEFWRYIRNTANGGHSFNIEADRDDLGDKAPKVFIDGDGADKVGRIFVNDRDVTEPA